MQTHTVNGREVTFSIHVFKGKQSYHYYEKAIYTALNKIGVRNNYITIETNNNGVSVSWEINGSHFLFQCYSQFDSRENIGAISQAIQEDVRQIQRGIKDLNLVMKQYETNHYDKKKQLQLNDFIKTYQEDIDFYQVNYTSNTFNSTIEAKEIIEKLKKKYSNFTDLSYLQEDDKKVLREAYIYLGIPVKF